MCYSITPKKCSVNFYYPKQLGSDPNPVLWKDPVFAKDNQIF